MQKHRITILSGLTVVFGLLTLATGIALHRLWRCDVRWRGQTLAYRGRSGIEVRRFEEVASVRLNPMGQAVLGFVDGTSLRIDLQATCSCLAAAPATAAARIDLRPVRFGLRQVMPSWPRRLSPAARPTSERRPRHGR